MQSFFQGAASRAMPPQSHWRFIGAFWKRFLGALDIIIWPGSSSFRPATRNSETKAPWWQEAARGFVFLSLVANCELRTQVMCEFHRKLLNSGCSVDDNVVAQTAHRYASCDSEEYSLSTPSADRLRTLCFGAGWAQWLGSSPYPSLDPPRIPCFGVSFIR